MIPFAFDYSSQKMIDDFEVELVSTEGLFTYDIPTCIKFINSLDKWLKKNTYEYMIAEGTVSFPENEYDLCIIVFVDEKSAPIFKLRWG